MAQRMLQIRRMNDSIDFVKSVLFPLFDDKRLQQHNTNLKKSRIGFYTEEEYNRLMEWVDQVYMALNKLDRFIHMNKSNASWFLPYYHIRYVRHYHIPFHDIIEQVDSGNLEWDVDFDYKKYENTIPYVRSDVRFLRNVFSRLRREKFVSAPLKNFVQTHRKPGYKIQQIDTSVPLQQQQQKTRSLKRDDASEAQRFYRLVNPDQFVVPPQYSRSSKKKRT